MVMIINEKSLCPTAHDRRSALRGSLNRSTTAVNGGAVNLVTKLCDIVGMRERSNITSLSLCRMFLRGDLVFFFTSYIVIVVRPAFVFINNLTKRAVYIFYFIAATTSIIHVVMIIIIIVYGARLILHQNIIYEMRFCRLVFTFDYLVFFFTTQESRYRIPVIPRLVQPKLYQISPNKMFYYKAVIL